MDYDPEDFRRFRMVHCRDLLQNLAKYPAGQHAAALRANPEARRQQVRVVTFAVAIFVFPLWCLAFVSYCIVSYCISNMHVLYLKHATPPHPPPPL